MNGELNQLTTAKKSVFYIDMKPEHAEPAAGSKSLWQNIPSLRKSFIVSSTDVAFQQIISECRESIASGISPERTATGSSGSYFIRSPTGPIMGIFKPRDEEPYADLNPRWTKWLHKHCSPCIFGRACLMPNGGYLSEAAASLVDQFFGLQLVPRTEVVQLAASTFSYGWCGPHTSVVAQFPEKIGSFQIFVDGFRPFTELEPIVRMGNNGFSSAFQMELEKLACLDYIVRNTDRTDDNWLLRVIWIDPSTTEIVSTQPVPPLECQNLTPVVKIAAIDHGLSFPWKHPTGLRRYPYSWQFLPCSLKPFSAAIRTQMLTKLGNSEQLCLHLTALVSSHDPSSSMYIPRILSVMRGQMWNLAACLSRPDSTPADLIAMPMMRVEVDGEHFWGRYGWRKDKGGFTEATWINGDRVWIREVANTGCWSGCLK